MNVTPTNPAIGHFNQHVIRSERILIDFRLRDLFKLRLAIRAKDLTFHSFPLRALDCSLILNEIAGATRGGERKASKIINFKKSFLNFLGSRLKNTLKILFNYI